MKIALRYILTALLFVLLSDCQDDDDEKLEYATTKTADVTDINSDGATFNAVLVAGTKSSVLDYGFVWGENPLVSLDNAESIRLGASHGKTGKFSAHVSSNLEAGKEYYVRSFVISLIGNDQHIYYAEYVTFKSLGSEAPKIFDFQPRVIGIGDLVTIKGKNFSNKTFNNIVTFGRILAGPSFSNDSIIQVIVPDSLAETNVPISVSIAGNKSSSEAVYEIKPPEITGFYPDYGYEGSQITITGRNFIKKHTTITSGKGSFTITYQEGQYIQATVNAAGGGTNPLTVTVFNKATSSENNFTNYSVTIENVNPLEGTFNDVITITGTNLNSYCYIGGVNAEVVSSTPTELKVKIPPDLAVSNATIGMYNNWWNQTIYDKTFKLNSITAQNFSPSTGAIGGTVTIDGDNFSPSINNSKVFFGDIQANTISATKNQIVAEVPMNSPVSSTLTVKVADQSVSLPGTFSLIPATITDFQPRQGTTGTLITISGENLSPNISSYGEIKIGSAYCSVINASATELVVKLGNVRENSISQLVVNLGSQQLTLPGTFECNWIEKNDIPFYRNGANYFTYNNKGYIFMGQSNGWSSYYPNDIWQYNATSDAWSSNSNSSAPSGRYYASGFLIDDSYFFGLGVGYSYQTDFYRYSLINDTWTSIANFPGLTRYGAFSFSANGKGYVGAGNYYSYNYMKDFWEYDPATDTWQSIGDFPGDGRYGGISFEVNGKIVVGLGYANYSFYDLYLFDPANKSWSKLNDFPGKVTFNATVFKINETAYVATGSGSNGTMNEVWAYDAQQDSWTQKTSFGGNTRASAAAFNINGKGYLGQGSYYGTVLNDLWEYDPDLDK